jgi:RNA polymerase sigma factor (sigma-70 family)
MVSDEDSAVDVGQPALGWWHDLYRRRYVPTVRIAGLVLGDFHAGEEIAQEAFARLLEAGEGVHNPDRYLTGTVINLCRSTVRRAARGRTLLGRLGSGAADNRFDEHVANRSTVLEALRRLPIRQREAVVLRFYAGLSDTETAKSMGVSIGTAKTHLRRGMASLSENAETQR